MVVHESNGGKILRLNKHGLDLKIANEYHDLKLNQNLSARNTGYHSSNYVVPNGDIASALDNLSMVATADQRHIHQLMEKIL